MQEVKRIRKLPLLSQVWLQGNPISYLEIYRKQTLLYFLSEVTLSDRMIVRADPLTVLSSHWSSMASQSLVPSCRGCENNLPTKQSISSECFLMRKVIIVLTERCIRALPMRTQINVSTAEPDQAKSAPVNKVHSAPTSQSNYNNIKPNNAPPQPRPDNVSLAPAPRKRVCPESLIDTVLIVRRRLRSSVS
jgi:hypothetical protein